jgi:hypothetical protein
MSFGVLGEYAKSLYTIWDRLSLKTISRYCPINLLMECFL